MEGIDDDASRVVALLLLEAPEIDFCYFSLFCLFCNIGLHSKILSISYIKLFYNFSLVIGIYIQGASRNLPQSDYG